MAAASITKRPIPSNPRFKNLIGKRFGRLVALEYAGVSGRSNNHWRCLCDCGNESTPTTGALLSGKTQSCGCYMKDVASLANITHGGGSHRSSALLKKTYHSYCGAMARCLKPNNSQFASYGARGIEFRFDSFEQLLAEIGVKPSANHSIDRINNDDHYEPGNVRWADKASQVRNRRVTIKVMLDGKSISLADACEKTGTPYHKAYSRIVTQGWTAEAAFNSLRNRKWLTINIDGEEVNLAEACRRKGMPYPAVKARIRRRGWDANRALNEPIRSST